MYHPTRGGARGGRDQFSWDEVKDDKYRENYLGHSVKASVGRWQKTKDLFWYTKKGNAKDKIEKLQEERKKLIEAEKEARLEALGLIPKRKKVKTQKMDQSELKELFKRGKSKDEGDTTMQGERIQGLGFAPSRHHEISEEVLNASSSSKSTNNDDTIVSKEEVMESERGRSMDSESRGSVSTTLEQTEDTKDELSRKERKKKEKKEKKDRKKEKKREKKERKREKKEKKREKYNPSKRSRSSSRE